MMLVFQLCLTLCNPMDCSPPSPFVRMDSPGKNTRVGSYPLLQGIFLTRGSNRVSCIGRRIPYLLSHQGSPLGSFLHVTEMVKREGGGKSVILVYLISNGSLYKRIF